MDRHTIFMSPNSLRSSSVQRNVTIHNNANTINTENRVMDLRKLSSRIICSDNITRQNLNKRASITASLPTEDDEQFFKNLVSNFKENYKPSINDQSSNLTRKRKPIIDKETQNVIKRFKKDTNNINSTQSLNNTNIIQANPINVLKKTWLHENIMQHENIVPSSTLNTNFRIPPSKFIFQVTSKLQNNILPFPTKETPILQEECKEALFYGMLFLTPPDSNSIEDNTNL